MYWILMIKGDQSLGKLNISDIVSASAVESQKFKFYA